MTGRRGIVAAVRAAWVGGLLLSCACSADEGSDGERRGSASGGASGQPGVGGDRDAPAIAGGDDAFGNPAMTTAGGAGSGAGGFGEVDMTCAEGMSRAAPVTPTVWLVLDSSGSMDESFGGPTRWQALRSALMDPGGVVETLESFVRFGMVIYNGPDNGQAQCNSPQTINTDLLANPLCLCFFGTEAICCDPICGGTPPPPPADGDCANLVTVDPALDNFATLDAAYPAEQIGGWTPTDRALDHVVNNLPVVNEQVLDQEVDPVYVILATDGAPNDRCGGNQGGGRGSGFEADVAARVVAAAQQGATAGMKMFVISLAGDDPQLQTHLEEVAMIGGTGQPPFEPSTKDDLVMTLQQIIGGATCQVQLDGSVQAGQHCSGSVELNGNALACDAEDGWRMADERTVQLTGSACTSFLGQESLVRASFPCGVFTPD